VRISAGDDFGEGDVAFDKNNAALGAGQTLAGELSMEFASEARGDFDFVISFRAEGPIASPVPAPTPGPVPPNITMTMAVRQVSEQFGDFEIQGYGTGIPSENSMGYFDHLLVHDGANPLAPFVAESWSVNTAGNELTLNIRKGIKFNTPTEFAGYDFGELTAHDVAWNMNRQNAVVNPSLPAGIGGQLGGTFAEGVAVDDYTVKVPMVTDIFWGIPISEFDINDTSVRLDSKKAYDDMGAAAMEFVPVGSGPFTIGEWLPNDRGTVHAVPDHWREPPHIGKFVVIQVPDTTSRLAMMQTGEIDLGEIDFGRIRELDGRGLKFIQTMTDADTMTLSTIWPGNLWTDVNAKTGDPLEPWNSSVYEQDYPWLGCPWGDKCPYDDNDNPDGMSDMEQARLVRWALSMTIDRQGIVNDLQGGLGTPIYLELMGPKFPGWQPDRTVNASMVKAAHERYGGTDWPEYDTTPAEPNYEWPWTIPTDSAESERLLDLAGYPRGSNGIRFDITLNKYACETGSVCLEQADAVAAGWESVGVRTTVLQEEYGAVIVPRMRDRTQTWPVVKNCSVETANYPFDWPPPSSDTTFSRPAWGCAFESEFLDYMYVNINGERQKSKREDLHLDMVDYYYYWQLYSGIVQPPRGVAANPNTVESWQSRSVAAGFWGRPQHIVPKQ
jgi:ABC-type transport system substrate-binding protein